MKFIVYKRLAGVLSAKYKKDDVFTPFSGFNSQDKGEIEEAFKYAKERADELEIEGFDVKIEKVD